MSRVILFKGYDSCFSNWARSKFTVDGIDYISSEQYMMAKKAELFGDDAIKAKIMDASGNDWHKLMKKIKALGRMVKNFDETTWANNRKEIVKTGILAKFTQNPDMRDTLLSTGDSIIGESVAYDEVWGTGINITSKNAYDPSKWTGQNLLGQILMEVRALL